MKNITTTYRTDAKPAIHAIKGSVKELGFGGRQYQIDAYNQFIDERNTLFISPTASGKSLVQVVCAAKQILDTNYTQKQLFIAPQLDIGNNFSEYKIKHIKVDGKNYEWEVTVNCCKNNKQSVKRLKKFLLSSHDYSSLKNKNKIGGCTAVATSAAFSAVWNDLTKKQKLFAIKNLSARIDESHHVMGVSNETDQNRLGDFVKFSLENNGHIHLTTATFFRGDNQPIIDLEYLPMFSKFAVPFMQHWQCLGLSSLTQEYHTYTDEEDLRQQVLAHIKSNPNQKPMIIVPSAGRGYFEDHEVKKTFIKSFVSDLEKVFGENKVLDLVSKDTQKAHKKRLTQDIRDFSCVVTCCIGREGTDWEECNTVHNTTVDGNVGLAIQKLGRPMRSHKDKTDIVMLNYFPSMPSFDDDREKVRSALSDRYNAVMVGSMLNDAFHPIVMPAKIKKKYKSKNNNDKDVATLEEVYGPASNKLLEDFYTSVDALPDDKLNNDTIDAIANKLIEEYKDAASFDVNAEDVRECLKKQLVRSKNPAHPKLKLEPINVEYVREHGWDKVIEENVKGKTYFTGFSDTNNLSALQSFLSCYKAIEVTENKLIECKNKKLSLTAAAKHIGVDHKYITSYCIKNYNMKYNDWAKVSFSQGKATLENIKECKNLKLILTHAANKIGITPMSLDEACIKLYKKKYTEYSGLNGNVDRNYNKIFQHNTTGTRNISYDAFTKKYRVIFTINRKKIDLGRFDSIQEAHLARQKALKELNE